MTSDILAISRFSKSWGVPTHLSDFHLVLTITLIKPFLHWALSKQHSLFHGKERHKTRVVAGKLVCQ